MAVNDFYQWSQNPLSDQMKKEFYPRVDKSMLFSLGYIALQSGHSRGSTVDLTIIPLPVQSQPAYMPGDPLQLCYADLSQRYRDNSIDMGTGYDCMDLKAHINNHFIDKRVYQNRMMLRYVMLSNGFVPYDKEWWHFTLKKEPYPKEAFNFAVK
jgi:zinc D-Ala-D-Ala dipeptidase